MAPSFGRSISFPLSPARTSRARAAAYHVRSASLPGHNHNYSSHPLLAHLSSHIAAIRSWAAASPAVASPATGLAHLAALHAALADLLLLPEAQSALASSASSIFPSTAVTLASSSLARKSSRVITDAPPPSPPPAPAGAGAGTGAERPPVAEISFHTSSAVRRAAASGAGEGSPEAPPAPAGGVSPYMLRRMSSIFMDPMPLALLNLARSEEPERGGCDDAAITRDDAMRLRPTSRPRPGGRRREAVAVVSLSSLGLIFLFFRLSGARRFRGKRKKGRSGKERERKLSRRDVGKRSKPEQLAVGWVL